MAKVTITLPDDSKFEAEPEDAANILRDIQAKGGKLAFNPTEFYFSESKDAWERIADMNSVHIFNALMKRYDAWIADLRGKVERSTYRATPTAAYRPDYIGAEIKNGPLDVGMAALLAELLKRKTWTEGKG